LYEGFKAIIDSKLDKKVERILVFGWDRKEYVGNTGYNVGKLVWSREDTILYESGYNFDFIPVEERVNYDFEDELEHSTSTTTSIKEVITSNPTTSITIPTTSIKPEFDRMAAEVDIAKSFPEGITLDTLTSIDVITGDVTIYIPGYLRNDGYRKYTIEDYGDVIMKSGSIVFDPQMYDGKTQNITRSYCQEKVWHYFGLDMSLAEMQEYTETDKELPSSWCHRRTTFGSEMICRYTKHKIPGTNYSLIKNEDGRVVFNPLEC